MYPHRIRLRGPWEYALFGDPPQKGRIALPCRWGESDLSNARGRVLLKRKFGWPGWLDSHERVWLTFASAPAVGEIMLNGTPLARGAVPCDDFDFEVTDRLRARNELILLVDVVACGDRSWGDVALEVRCAAYLRDVKLAATVNGAEMEVRATGRLAGEPGARLELYLLLENSTVAYQTIEPHPDGKPFELVSERVPAPHGRTVPVRIDLMQGGIVWYVADQTVTIPEK